jgi:hypothetical protein
MYGNLVCSDFILLLSFQTTKLNEICDGVVSANAFITCFLISVYLASLLHSRIFSLYVYFRFLILKLQVFQLDWTCVLVSFKTISSGSFI